MATNPIVTIISEIIAPATIAARPIRNQAAADRLEPISDSSVDVVTTRSVLIYVAKKASAFAEFHRVLRPAGHLSIFEPINRFTFPEPPGILDGFDLRALSEATSLSAMEGMLSQSCYLLPPYVPRGIDCTRYGPADVGAPISAIRVRDPAPWAGNCDSAAVGEAQAVRCEP